MISDELKRRGIEHVVLNAKPEHAEREGETIAQAGRKGAVTIATNMAGRGVDIKLGGDPEQLAHARAAQARAHARTTRATRRSWTRRSPSSSSRRCEAEAEEVRELGGLFICGTERHESRRIDNQLRGRSGRQGDPGESRFFLSAEDDLIRLFAGDRIYKILDRLGPVDEEGEEMPLEAKMLTKTVENAQKKVEEQNFLIRKRVLEYDDVMNEQRRVVYKYRREILEGRDMSDVAREELERGRSSGLVDEYTPGDVLEDWDLAGARDPAPARSGRSASTSPAMAPEHDRPRGAARDAARRRRAGRLRRARAGVRRRADAPPRALDPAADHRQPLARAPLRHGLPARGHPPPRLRPDRPAGRLQERGLLDVRGADALDLGGVRTPDLPRRGRDRARAGAGAFAPHGAAEPAALDYSGGTAEPALGAAARRRPRRPRAPTRPPSRRSSAEAGRPATAAPDPSRRRWSRTSSDKIGRNDPCWCGSGKKYKKCHGA